MTTKKIYGPWIKWHGGECPVPSDTKVKVKYDYGGSVTEALRAKFEKLLSDSGRACLYEGDGQYAYPHDFAWLCYQAGHAAAKAAAADPVVGRWLAAAADAEREKCAGIVNELRMECARRNMPESATMLWHAEDALRAGAKETGNG